MKFRLKYRYAILAMLFAVLELAAYADMEDETEEIIEDANEGAAVGPKKGNFIPVPLPVSNPTVGTGLQAVLLYLHPKSDENSQTPNATSGITAMYTDSHSWFAGVFHSGYLANDRYRVSGFLGYGDLNLKFYGIGDNPILGDNPIDYEFNAFIFGPKFLVRIPNTKHWFVGGHYLYLDTENVFKTSEIIEGLPDIEFSEKTAGLGLVGTYDSRDNNYYPIKGKFFETKLTNYSETWGGEYRYNKWITFFNLYQPLRTDTVLALRARGEFSEGNVPYFNLASLDMRGFDRGRYRDRHSLSLHAEGRHKFTSRWGMVAFVETGWFNEDVKDMFSGRTIVSYGGGVRWQVTKNQKLHLGLDVAFSNDEKVVFIQIGERF